LFILSHNDTTRRIPNVSRIERELNEFSNQNEIDQKSHTEQNQFLSRILVWQIIIHLITVDGQSKINVCDQRAIQMIFIQGLKYDGVIEPDKLIKSAFSSLATLRVLSHAVITLKSITR
jgi:hypothetical protein